MLHPPPIYKLKIKNDSEHQALIYLCQLNANGHYNSHNLLSIHIRFIMLAKEVKGKEKYSIELRAHEAIELCNIINFTNTSLEGKLSIYNSTLYQRWANSINENIVSYLLALETPKKLINESRI